MQLTQNRRPINLISPGIIKHTVDNDIDNVVEESGLLYVEAPGNIKVTYLNGVVDTLIDYDNYAAVDVKKVCAEDTTIDHSKIKLFE